jgi:ribosome-binding protein aMBF1 (putative translation factor)
MLPPPLRKMVTTIGRLFEPFVGKLPPVPDSAAQLQRRFGQALRAERKAQELTQQSVAFAADLSLTYVGEIERGERMISLDTLVRLSKALKITPAEFITKVAP